MSSGTPDYYEISGTFAPNGDHYAMSRASCRANYVGSNRPSTFDPTAICNEKAGFRYVKGVNLARFVNGLVGTLKTVGTGLFPLGSDGERYIPLELGVQAQASGGGQSYDLSTSAGFTAMVRDYVHIPSVYDATIVVPTRPPAAPVQPEPPVGASGGSGGGGGGGGSASGATGSARHPLLQWILSMDPSLQLALGGGALALLLLLVAMALF